MKITRLILGNFTGIYTGMKLKKFELDLSRAINKITLLIGPNGSGKTTVLSQLHPFAYPGTMDIRNGTDIILDKHDGYKEVNLIDDDGSEYIVKHFYTSARDSRTVKSFISKNGVELNPNGNVTSFKEVVELELGLEQDFLKLLRLGSNVTSFIGMKSTDRKKFTSALLADVDIYSGYYKKINDDSRVLKTMIKSSSEKLRRLGIEDEEVTSQSLIKMTKTLSSLTDKKDEVMMNMGKVKGSMESLYDNGLRELEMEISSLETNIKMVEKERATLQKALDKLDSLPINNIDSYRKELEKTFSTLDKEAAVLVSELTLYLNELDALYAQKETKENNLKYIDSDVHISNLEQMQREIYEEISELKSEMGYFDSSTAISKEEALTLLNTIKDIRYIILDILALDMRGEIKAFYSYAKGNVKSIVRKKIDIIDKSMLTINMQLNQEINEYGKNELLVLYQLCEHDECPYIKYYNNTSGQVVTKKEELKSRLSKLDTERTYYSNILNIDELMGTIGYIFKHNSDLIKRSPFTSISPQLISDCLTAKSTDLLSDLTNKISDYISKVECFNEIKEKEVKAEDISKEVEMLKRNSKSLDLLKDDISGILDRINSLSSTIVTHKERKAEILEKRDEAVTSLREVDRYIEIKDELNEKDIELKALKDSLKNNCNIREYLAELDGKYSSLEDEFRDVGMEMDLLQRQMDDIRMRLREHQSLSKELAILDDKFEDISIMKESLSSSAGIPLLFVQLYLRSTRKFVNELLHFIYKGTLEIETFVINDKEFRIPYTKNGITVDDVIYASQGETSFISLVMSLALIKQSIKKYNILLLDEVDSTLDQESRSIFLNLLEIYFEEIGCEQAFMTTHNNAFDNYDVDMIITAPDVNIDNYKKVNVVYRR